MVSAQTSQDLFNKIRSKFSNLEIGNNLGEATANPQEAVFFDFEFTEDSDTFGRISLSLADGENLKVFYNKGLVDKIDEDDKADWYGFLKELKDFAVTHQLGFDVRDITKSNLTQQDFKNIADANQTVNIDDMSEEINRITKLAGIHEIHPMAGEISRLAAGMNDQKAQEIINKIGSENLSQLKKHSTMGHSLPDTVKRDPKMKDTVLALTAIDDIAIHGFDSKLLQLIFSKIGGEQKIAADINEGLTGTSKSSFENLDKTRLIIRHSKPVAEEVPGARTRHINSLYIENSEGERFKYPIVHLAGARAMTRHVANGGVPHDDFGQHIVNTSEQIAQLNSFNRYVATKDQLNDSAGDIIERAKSKCESMKKYMKNLSKQSHYESAKESFKPAEMPELDDATKTSLQDKFTLRHFDEKIDSALPLLNSIMKEFDDEKPLSKKDIEIPAPVDAAPLVQQYLADPENKLVLRQDPAADQMLARTNFTNKNTMLSSILGDIAARMLTKTPEQDRVANFASHVANEISQEGEPFFEPHKNYIRDKKVAFQLAKRYIDDYKKMKQDPEYVSQVRMDPAAYEPKKDRQGKAKEEIAFEGWADNITEQKPYVSMYRGDDGKMVYDVLDKDGESAYVSSDYDVATAYLRKNFDRLAGRKTDDHFDTAMTQTAMDDVNENPEANQEMSMDYEFTGDDGETAYGTLHYKVVNGKVDPNSLRGESEWEGNAKVDDEFATDMVKPGGPDHEEALEAAQDDYEYEAQRMQSKFGEGNEFALAVQKAKAAGMKPGDKFEVGGKEYTLKDAIEQAGLQLEEFFTEDEYAEPSKEHYKKACEAGFKGSYEDYKKEYASFPDEFPKNEAEAEPKKCDHCDGTGKHGDKDCEVCGGRGYITEAKPDFLDLDKDGNKTEPMKSAAKDAKKESTELDSIIKLAGL